MTKNLLLVSPAFQDYWKAMSAAFEAQGWTVHTHVYDQPGPFFARTANAVSHSLPHPGVTHRISEYLTDLAISRLQQVRPDAVVVIRGDQLSARWWDAVHEHRVPLLTWAYDEIRRMRDDFVENARIGTIATYSAPDADRLQADGVDAFYLPNAFDQHSHVEPRRVRATTFIGARYANREQALLALHAAGVPVVAYGKTWSSRLTDRIRTRRFRTMPFVTHPDISRAQAYGVMSGSDATLNSHWNQEGFTMRTFEACGVGGVQLIDRADVEEFYEPGTEVLTYSGTDHLVDLCTRIARGALRTDPIRVAAQKRTLAEHTFDHRIRALLEHL